MFLESPMCIEYNHRIGTREYIFWERIQKLQSGVLTLKVVSVLGANQQQKVKWFSKMGYSLLQISI